MKHRFSPEICGVVGNDEQTGVRLYKRPQGEWSGKALFWNGKDSIATAARALLQPNRPLWKEGGQKLRKALSLQDSTEALPQTMPM